MKKLLKKQKVSMIAMLAVVILFSLLALITFPYEDSEDWMLALMWFGIPGIVLCFTIISFINFDKFYSGVAFVLTRMLYTFVIIFGVEAILILIVFGITRPQYKLFPFALAFAGVSSVIIMIFSIIYCIVSKKAKKSK